MIKRLILMAFLSIIGLNTYAQAQKVDLSRLPQPFCEDYPHFKEIYDKAWEIAWSHITYKEGMPQSPFIDEAFSDEVDWIWDTQFMLIYWRYASHLGNWILTNNNFYKPIHDNTHTVNQIHIPDNPPMFAWSEMMYNKISGDTEHLKQLLNVDKYLQRHFVWFDEIQPGTVMWGSAPTCLRKVDNGYLWEGGRSGMDNTPRGRTVVPAPDGRPNNPNMLWVDAISQQAMVADNLSYLFSLLDNEKDSRIWSEKRDSIADIINRLYWDDADGFYYDIDRRDYTKIKVATPASYWALLAGAAPQERAAELAKKATDPFWFGAAVPFTSLRPTDPNFRQDGGYWRGALWLPTAYMSIKALDKYGYFKEAHDAAVRIIEHQYQTYKRYSPNTIWECYNPTQPRPSVEIDYVSSARPNFCGWSALGPISMFIEDVLGFYDIDANTKTIRWNRTLEKPHGIKNLNFGDITTDIIWDGNKVVATSNKPFTLIVNGEEEKVYISTGISYNDTCKPAISNANIPF